MLKKYVHTKTGGDVIISDPIQIAAFISEGFIYKCDVIRVKAELKNDLGENLLDENKNKIFYDTFQEVVEDKKKK